MHARPPPMNVMLYEEEPFILTGTVHEVDGHSQVRIDTGNLRIRDTSRKRLQPALGLPLERVLSPDGLVPVS